MLLKYTMFNRLPSSKGDALKRANKLVLYLGGLGINIKKSPANHVKNNQNLDRLTTRGLSGMVFVAQMLKSLLFTTSIACASCSVSMRPAVASVMIVRRWNLIAACSSGSFTLKNFAGD